MLQTMSSRKALQALTESYSVEGKIPLPKVPANLDVAYEEKTESKKK